MMDREEAEGRLEMLRARLGMRQRRIAHERKLSREEAERRLEMLRRRVRTMN